MRYRQGFDYHFRTNGKKLVDENGNAIAGVSVEILFHFYKNGKEYFFTSRKPREQLFCCKSEFVYVSELLNVTLAKGGIVVRPTGLMEKIERLNYHVSWEVVGYYKQVYVTDPDEIKKMCPYVTKKHLDILKVIPLAIPEEMQKNDFIDFTNKNWEYLDGEDNKSGQALGWFYKKTR